MHNKTEYKKTTKQTKINYQGMWIYFIIYHSLHKPYSATGWELTIWGAFKENKSQGEISWRPAKKNVLRLLIKVCKDRTAQMSNERWFEMEGAKYQNPLEPILFWIDEPQVVAYSPEIVVCNVWHWCQVCGMEDWCRSLTQVRVVDRSFECLVATL